MFKRREALSFGKKIIGFLWPTMGWRRTVSYLVHRLGRMPGSAYSIAGGFACGAAISFTPFVGLHFVLGGILAWLMRANIVASAIGTAVGNPWTFPFIWTWLYKTGTMITDTGLTKIPRTEAFGQLFGDALEAALRFDLEFLLETVAPVFWPMLLSSIPTAFVVWWIFYLPLKYLIQGYQERRVRKRQRSVSVAKEEGT